jgi:hypothetical protein
MKLYHVEFGFSFNYEIFNGVFSKDNTFPKDLFQWEKDSSYKGYIRNPSTQAEQEEQAELKANWDRMELSEAMKTSPEYVKAKWDCRMQILTESQFHLTYRHCTIINLLDVDTSEQFISDATLNKLADLIVTKLNLSKGTI